MIFRFRSRKTAFLLSSAVGLAMVVGITMMIARVSASRVAFVQSRFTLPSAVIKQGPQATHPHLQWINMTSLQHGWALNRSDRLLVTWNGGHIWNRTPAVEVAGGGIENGTFWNTTQVQGFYALNARDAWVSTWVRHGFYRTINGGHTWVKLQAPGAGWLDFLTPERGWLLTSDGVASGQYPSQLYTTTDGGIHWHLVASTFSTHPKTSQPTLPLDLKTGLMFHTPTEGWIAAGSPYYSGVMPAPPLASTHNGGRTWTLMELPKEPGTGSPTASPPEFFPLTGQDGLIPLISWPFTPSLQSTRTQTLVWYQTTDSGQRWTRAGQITRVNQPTGMGALDVSFVSAADGWVLWGGQRLWHTDNGGRTWHSWVIHTPAYPGVRLVGIDFLTARQGWAVSVRGQLLTTGDGGHIWNPIGS